MGSQVQVLSGPPEKAEGEAEAVREGKGRLTSAWQKGLRGESREEPTKKVGENNFRKKKESKEPDGTAQKDCERDAGAIASAGDRAE